MSKRSDNRKKSKQQKNKSIIPSTKQQKNSIPFTDKTDEYYEVINKNIVFIFKDYLHRECGLGKITQTKNLIGKLSHISTIKKIDIKDNSSIIRKVIPCEHNNEYKKLFCKKGFEQYESDFYEIECSDTNRVFGYFIDNIFHIILIKDRHLKVDKK